MRKITKRFFLEKTKNTNRTQNLLKVMMLLLVVLTGVKGLGQVNYVSWNFTTALSTGQTYDNSQSNMDNVRSTALTSPTLTGVTITGATAANNSQTLHRTTTWNANTASVTASAAKYVEFTITLASGQTFPNSDLTLNMTIGNSSATTAPNRVHPIYGYGSSPTFALIGNALSLTTTQTPQTAITIPAPGNTTTTRLSIRLAAYNTATTGTSGNFRISSIALTGATPLIAASLTPPFLTAAGSATVDAPFNVTFTDDSSWRSAISSITVGGTTLAAGAYSTTTSGQIAFTPSVSALLQSSGSKSIAVIASGYSNATVSQTILAGVPTKLAIGTQPTAPAANGGALAAQPIIRIQDQYNNTTTSTASVSAAVGSGTWTLGGTTSASATAGTATFSGLTATSAVAVTGATIAFSSGSLTGVTSGTFNIPAPAAPAPANDLCGSAIALTPGAAAISGTLTSSTVTSPFSTKNDVWYSFTPTCTGSATLTVAGFKTTTEDVDVEMFSNSNSCPSTITTLHTSAGNTGTEAITQSFTSGVIYFVRVLDFGTIASVFTIAVTSPTPATPVVVTNAATPVATTTATLTGSVTTLGVCPTTTQKGFVYSLTGTNDNPVALGSGVTTTSVLSLVTGAYTLPLTSLTSGVSYTYKAYLFDGTIYTYGTAVNFITTATPPTLTAAVNPTVDSSFNVTFTDNSAWRGAISSITVGGTTLAPAAYSISDGQITLTPSASTLLQSSGAKAIVVLATGYSNATVSQTILAGASTKLAVLTQPTAPTANGGTLVAQPVIRIQDQYNNTTTSTASITATAAQGTWTLGGTSAVAAVAGTTTFSGLTATSVGLVTGATITFTSAGLTSVTSNTFNIPAPIVDFVSIAALGTAVTENFNGMGTSIGTVIPAGFGIQDADTATVSLSVGAASSTGSPTSGDSYNWGQSASERALGLMFSGSYSSRSVIVKLRNNTGTAVNSFTIGFDYEQYRRNNSATQTFKLQYSTSLTSGWVDVTGGAFSSIVSGTSLYNFTTLIASENISNLVYTPAASISAGSDVYFRWILDGGSNSRGVGIDNFSITAKATPTITIQPTATAIALGQTLASSILSGGATSGNIAGTFTFTTPSTTPLAGTASQGVTFTPSNTTSYNTATTTASVTVSDVTTYTNADGTNPLWSFGTPTPLLNAVLAANYSTNNGVINAKNLTVNNGVRFTVNAGANGATISESITNNGQIVVENNANLIQTATGIDTNTSANGATALVFRNSNSLFRLAYTMWSSPVSGSQTLGGFSPLTTPSRNYIYRPDTNVYTSVGNTGTFATGKGYLIRMPDALSSAVGANLTEYYKGNAPLTYEGGFSGTRLNNGDVTITTTSGTYNAVGNPYPSTISAAAFLSANSTDGILYFWRKTNGVGTSYASYSVAMGGVINGGFTPNASIQVGQGFIVKANSTSLVFNNTMRTGATAQFLKTKEQAEISRVWLNLNNADGMVNQTLVGYLDAATTGFDQGIDGKSFGDGAIELASNIDGASYTIQGRPAFDATDVVALNFKTSVAGTYTIAIDHVDGLFSKGQDIYLVDKTTGTTTNLNEGAYNFTAAAGVDNTRFTLTYQKTLKVDAPLFNENSVVVSRNNGTLNVKSTAVAINNVKVFDIQGRLVAERKNVKSNSASFSNLKANQVLIVQVTSDNNGVVTKKVLN